MLKLGQKEITAKSGVDFEACIEYMSQIPVIIKGTFEENILMGKKMDRQKFEQAVKDADLENVRDNLTDGEKTVISETMLSSGEKQKIALARVFYQDKPVWVLDEPTSALDPEIGNPQDYESGREVCGKQGCSHVVPPAGRGRGNERPLF